MDQEKLSKMSQSSNPNMPRDTVETLKQIQKQGLSISIVSNNSSPFSLPATATPDIRPKQNVLPVDKSSKGPARTQSITENKPQAVPIRGAGTPETRVSSARITPQSTFHDSKPTLTPNRVNQLELFESKVFSPNWAGSNTPTDNKVPGNINRAMLSTPVNKAPTSQARLGQLLMAENKTPVSRINQVMLPENKIQGRVAQRVGTVPNLIDSKILNNQERANVNPASPPEAKLFANQVRTSQPFVATHESKTPTGPRMIAPKPTGDIKLNQSVGNKQVEIKSAVNRVVPNMRLLPDNKTRPNYVTKADGKNIISSGIVGDKIANQALRMVATVADIGPVRNPPIKVSTSQLRLHQIPALSEIPTSVHAKMVQSVPVQADGKIILPGSKVPVSSSDMAQKPGSAFEVSPEASLANPLAIRGPAKRGSTAGSPAKKKCIKRLSQNASGLKTPSMPEHGALNSSEDGSENGEKFFSTLKSNRGLTITPIRPTLSSATTPTLNSSGAPRMSAENLDKDMYRVVCPSCSNVTSSPKFCHICKCSLSTSIQNTQQSTELVQNLPGASYVVTKKLTNVIKHQIIIKPNDGMGQSQSIQFDQTVQKKLLIKATSNMIQSTSKPRGGSKRRRYVEPVCLTLSSDDEQEYSSFNSFVEDNMSQSQAFPQESEGSKSGQSSPAYQDEENNESDDQFPGVTDINPKILEERVQYDEEDEGEYRDMDEMEIDEENESIGEEEEEPEEEEVDEEEEEEIPPEDEEDEGELMNKSFIENAGMDDALRCRSVRIGSLKVHPKTNNSSLHVLLASDGMSFNAPMVTDQNKIVNITLKPSDITQMLVHFGRCLPIVFIFTTPGFAESLRKALNMLPGDYAYFDPTSNDEKQKKITFLVDSINEDQRRFLRSIFLNEKKVQELDQKTANEILVRSTPNQTQLQKCDVVPQPIQVSQENQLTVTPLQPSISVKLVTVPVPVVKLLTYPPPPQTGGIAITNEDLACLDEGEFLNDAIIDFYLKYVFYEKLSEYHREKTHVFSSYFFPRLTHKPERSRPGDEGLKTLQARRHSQVKTWTRHVDIFSKDFIIIPVNQNVHWFLAIICYPGLVPEVTELIVPKPDSKTNSKSIDNVTSTDDQDENKPPVAKEPNAIVDGSNPNSDENSTASSSSVFDNEEPDSEEPPPEAPDSSTHPDKNRRRKEAPCICIFDSLNGPNRSRIATMLREYLEIEWKMKKGTRKVFDKNTMQGFIMQCPQQTNYSDCGIYLLQYVESFFESPIPYFDTPIASLATWFPKEKVAKKREELKDLIASLQKKHETTRKSISTSDVVPPPPAPALQTDNR